MIIILRIRSLGTHDSWTALNCENILAVIYGEWTTAGPEVLRLLKSDFSTTLVISKEFICCIGCSSLLSERIYQIIILHIVCPQNTMKNKTAPHMILKVWYDDNIVLTSSLIMPSSDSAGYTKVNWRQGEAVCRSTVDGWISSKRTCQGSPYSLYTCCMHKLGAASGLFSLSTFF